MRLGIFYFGPNTKYDFNSGYFPNNLGYIASYLEKYSGYDQTFIENDFEQFLKKKPDIAGISSYTETFNQAQSYAQIIKEKLKIPVLIGGHHISNLPNCLNSDMDIGIIGEGEETVLELMNLFLQGKANQEELKKVDGIVFHGENGLEMTRSRLAISPLDKVPFPKRSLGRELSIPVKQYNIMTSRGCPFTCIYCTAGLAIEKNRYHSVERVISEMEYLLANHADQEFISISDDLFAVNKKRLLQLAKAMKEAGLNKKIPFGCNARASVFDEEIASILLEMNVKFVTFGLESGNDRMLKYLKGAASLKKNQEALDICKKYNLQTYTHFIIGNPTEKLAETADTYWFIRRNSHQISSANAMFATPLPGTVFWKNAIKDNLISENFQNWDGMNLWFDPQKSVYLNKEYSAELMFSEVIPSFKELVTGKNPPYLTAEYYQPLIDLPGENILEITASPTGLNNYREVTNYQKLNFSNGQLTLPADNKLFDLILFSDSFQHARNPDELLPQILSRLSPGGIISFSWENNLFANSLIKIIYNFERDYKIKIQDEDRFHFFTLKYLQKILDLHGLFIEKIFPVFYADFQINQLSEIFARYFSREVIAELKIKNYYLTCRRKI